MTKLVILILLFTNSIVLSQQIDTIKSVKTDTTKKWTYFYMSGLSISQGKSINWAEGSLDNFSILSYFNAKINYNHKKTKWDNLIDFKLGFLKTELINLHKNDDNILLSSNYGKQIKNNFYYVGVISFKSQLFNGYNYPNDSVIVSDFLSPAYWYVSLGINYKKKEKFDLLLSPLTSKSTIVVNQKVDETKYGLDEGSVIKREMGAYINFKTAFNLDKNVLLNNKIELFSNYFHNPENIDINFESKLFLKINDYLSTTININLIYDDDIDIPIYKIENGKKQIIKYSKRLQFKELISVGFLYKVKK